MKVEHFETIERAKMHGVMPSVLAHELLVRDLVEAAMFEWQNIAAPFSKLNEGQRQEVTDRVTEKVTQAVYSAVAIISSRSVDTIPLTVADAKFKAKSITVTATIDAQDPNRHGLIDVAGKLCLLVLAPNDYAEALDSLQVERDQRDLPLHASELTGDLLNPKHDPLYKDAKEMLIAYGRLGPAAIAGSMGISSDRAASMLEAMVKEGFAVAAEGGNVFETAVKGPSEAGQTTDTGTDELYAKAVTYVVESQKVTISSIQRELGITFQRASVLVDAMEKNGVVSPIDHAGTRLVLIEPTLSDDMANDLHKEFGDFTYEDAAQLLVLKAPKKGFNADWLQSRLAIDSEKASTLLLRLLDNEVIKVDAEGESALTHTYKVTATLEDVA